MNALTWRIVRQKRRVGLPVWLQQGRVVTGNFGRKAWRTVYEENYATIEQAKARLAEMTTGDSDRTA